MSLQAQWISGGRVLKGLLSVDRMPRNSRAYIAGIGYYELHINGQRVGDHVLDPGFTNYDKRVLYSTYDIAPHLRTGRNEVEITLGPGWQAFDGPQIGEGVYHGEDFDATRARSPQQFTLPTIHPKLSAQSFPAITVQGLRPALSLNQLGPGVYVYDFGQNLTGWAEIRL